MMFCGVYKSEEARMFKTFKSAVGKTVRSLRIRPLLGLPEENDAVTH